MLARFAASPLGRWSEPLINQPPIVGTILKWLAIPLRLYAGYILIQYGYDKLFNNDANYAMSVRDMFVPLGLPAPELMHFLSGAVEFFGSLALILGFFTRFFGFALAFNMLVAMLTVHNLAEELPLFIICAALVVIGGGMLSLDQMIDRTMASAATPARQRI